MANIQKKSFEKCCNNAKRIIQSTDRWIDGERLPVIVYDINPTVEEACEAIKFIIDTGWIGGIVYAKKMVYVDHTSFEDNVFRTKIGFIITDNEKDFTKLEKNEHSFFRAIDSFPEITGIPLESNKPGEKYDGNIFLKSINEFHLDKPTWEKHHNLSLNKNDLVIVYFNSSERNFSTMNMNLGTYTGFKKIDSETEQTYYEIKIGDNTMLLPRGINCIGAHFITQQEFLITANNAKDAIHKTPQLFEKFNLAKHKLDNIETSKKHN